jgi:hypothetical protein
VTNSLAATGHQNNARGIHGVTLSTLQIVGDQA